MIFDTLAFPSYFFNSDGTLVHASQGSLFDAPSASQSPNEVNFYSRIRSPGWHKCPLGYDIYAAEISAEDSGLGIAGILIVPALRIKGGPRSNDKMEGLQALVDKAYIVQHVNMIVKAYKDIAQSFDGITRQNIHEVKGINSGIYNAAIQSQTELESGRNVAAIELIKNVSALSQILAARTDFMTFIANADILEPDYGPVQVYKKFDRMSKCFTAQAKKRQVRIEMHGSSFASAYGPKDFLDLAAYILIDNAVKYSPQGETVLVQANDSENLITVSVSSIGPRIQPDEVEKIFVKDFRSQTAEHSGVSGTGIGLYALGKTIIPAFGGKISAHPGVFMYERNGIPYDRVSFNLDFPIY